ncbi:hypothetical protein [Streptomyces mirabilis]|uniref:hypothetical protein n=1 Tax=Streptomyces mirabilis TaxID=68239 RepID=UPI0033B07443
MEDWTAPRRRPCARICCVADAARVRRRLGRPTQVIRQQADYLKVRRFDGGDSARQG